MKKTIITLIALMFTLTVFGQALKEERAAAYAAEAQKEFRLDAEKTAKVKELWMARFDEFGEVGRAFKSGAISEEQKNDRNREVAKKYTEKMSKLLGLSPAEFRKFNSSTMKKIKN